MVSKAQIEDYIRNCWDEYDVEEGIEYAEWHIETVNTIGIRTFGRRYPKHDYDKLNKKDKARVLMYGRRYTRNDDDVLDPVMQNYFIGEHVKMHEHHPEHWDNSIDANDFDESRPPHVDCSLMSNQAIIEMVCDWSAVAISFGSDQLSWYKRTVGDNKRFGFTKRQRKAILEGLKKVADTCGDMGCWIDNEEYRRLMSEFNDGMDESVMEEPLEEKTYHDGLPHTIEDVRHFRDNPKEFLSFLETISSHDLYNGEYEHVADQWWGQGLSEGEQEQEVKATIDAFLDEEIGLIDAESAEEEYAKGTINLYRFIACDDFIEEELGRCWAKNLSGVLTFVENELSGWIEEKKHLKLVYASTPTDNINWVATLLAVMDGYCEEEERRIIDDGKMDIIWIKEFSSLDEAYDYFLGEHR